MFNKASFQGRHEKECVCLLSNVHLSPGGDELRSLPVMLPRGTSSALRAPECLQEEILVGTP